jgi:hypothetical protein
MTVDLDFDVPRPPTEDEWGTPLVEPKSSPNLERQFRSERIYGDRPARKKPCLSGRKAHTTAWGRCTRHAGGEGGLGSDRLAGGAATPGR